MFWEVRSGVGRGAVPSTGRYVLVIKGVGSGSLSLYAELRGALFSVVELFVMVLLSSAVLIIYWLFFPRVVVRIESA